MIEEAHRPRWVLVTVLASGAFTSTLNVTLTSPLLKPIAVDFGIADAVAGQLSTVTAVCAGLTALLAAPWLDRFSRGTWLRGEATLLGFGTLVAILAPSLLWVFIGRALAGVGGAFIFAICLAAVADLIPDSAPRNRAIGVVGTGATIGVIVGLPVVTQIAGGLGWRWAMASILPFAALLFVGSSHLPRLESPKENPAGHDWVTTCRSVLTNRQTVSLLGIMVTLCMAWFGWLIYFGAFAHAAFALSTTTLGLLFLSGGGAEVAANNLTPLLLRRGSASTVILGAVAVLTADLLGVGFVDSHLWTLFPFIAIASFASIVVFTSTSILLLDTQPAARGTVMALQSTGVEFGGALGVALVGGALAIFSDYEVVYRMLGIVFSLLMVPLLLVGRRTAPLREPAELETVS